MSEYDTDLLENPPLNEIEKKIKNKRRLTSAYNYNKDMLILKPVVVAAAATYGGLLAGGAATGGLAFPALCVYGGFSLAYAIKPILDGRSRPFCPMLETILGYLCSAVMGIAGEIVFIPAKIIFTVGSGVIGLASLEPLENMKNTWAKLPSIGSTFMGCISG